MELLIDGIKHDWNKELEIFNNDKGFDISVKYKTADELKEHVKSWAGMTDVFHNCTEFHHLYNYMTLEDRIARDIKWRQDDYKKSLEEMKELIAIGKARVNAPNIERITEEAKWTHEETELKCAFESDIHSRGCTHREVHIASIHVVTAKVIHDDY
jgi:hypothetical protein